MSSSSRRSLVVLLASLLAGCAPGSRGPAPALAPRVPAQEGPAAMGPAGNDRDQDSMPDAQDSCPDDPEDADGFEDGDGCPDPDNDEDRILDVDDQCPNDPETYNGTEDGDGCPDDLYPSVRLPAPPPGCGSGPELVSGATALGPSKVSAGSVMDPRFGGSRGFFPITGQPPAPGSGSSTALELRLSGPGTTSPGEALGLGLSFRNRSKGPLVVMRPLDGSLERWRQPTYDLYLTDQGSGRTYRWAYTGTRCGNVNSIGPDDYVTLAPGRARSDVVNGWAEHLASAAIAAPGRYTAWVVYTFCSYEGRGLPLGREHRRTDVHLGVYGSNPLPIIVR